MLKKFFLLPIRVTGQTCALVSPTVSGWLTAHTHEWHKNDMLIQLLVAFKHMLKILFQISIIRMVFFNLCDAENNFSLSLTDVSYKMLSY